MKVGLGACLIVVGSSACGGGVEADLRANNIDARAIACIESPAFSLFGAALCVCEDLTKVGAIRVRPLAAEAAAIGVNGDLELVASARINGNLVVGGRVDTVADLDVTADATINGDVAWVGTLDVARNLSVGGDLSGTGALTVGETLALGGDLDVVGSQTFAAQTGFAGAAALPCACGEEAALDVDALVAAAAAADDVIHTGSLGGVGSTALTLTTGRYFTESITNVGALSVRVEGAVAWFIAGSIDLVGSDLVELAPGATLDLYLAGELGAVGALDLGSGSDASSVRIYAGGSAEIEVVGSLRGVGALYAPDAVLAYTGSLDLTGALFVRSLDGVGDLRIDYAHPGSPDGQDCGELPPSSEEDPGAEPPAPPPLEEDPGADPPAPPPEDHPEA